MGDIRVDPLLAPLHGDPRFEALAEKIIPAREFTSLGTGAYTVRYLFVIYGFPIAETEI
jgi:hypothetical protein